MAQIFGQLERFGGGLRKSFVENRFQTRNGTPEFPRGARPYNADRPSAWGTAATLLAVPYCWAGSVFAWLFGFLISGSAWSQKRVDLSIAVK